MRRLEVTPEERVFIESVDRRKADEIMIEIDGSNIVGIWTVFFDRVSHPFFDAFSAGTRFEVEHDIPSMKKSYHIKLREPGGPSSEESAHQIESYLKDGCRVDPSNLEYFSLYADGTAAVWYGGTPEGYALFDHLSRHFKARTMRASKQRDASVACSFNRPDGRVYRWARDFLEMNSLIDRSVADRLSKTQKHSFLKLKVTDRLSAKVYFVYDANVELVDC